MNNMTVLMPVLGIHTWQIVLIVVIVVLIASLVALSIYGKKLQDRQEASQKELQAAAQTASLLIIDKKRMKLKESGLPQIVIEQTPKRFRGQKLPIVKAKIGPKIMSFICDEKIFEQVPVKKEVKAVISGIYIMELKSGRVNPNPVTKRKVKFSEKMRTKMNAQLEKARKLEEEEKKQKQKNAKGNNSTSKSKKKK